MDNTYGKLIMNGVIYSGLTPEDLKASNIEYVDLLKQLGASNVQEAITKLIDDKVSKSTYEDLSNLVFNQSTYIRDVDSKIDSCSNMITEVKNSISGLDSGSKEVLDKYEDLSSSLSALSDDFKAFISHGGSGVGSGTALLKIKVPEYIVKVLLSDGQSVDVVDDSISFNVSYGDYTITAIPKDGDTITQDISIDTLKVYDITLYGYNLEGWLASCGISTEYKSIHDIPEKDMRKLMTYHRSVDILCKWYDIDTSLKSEIPKCKYLIKWLGLRDYAYAKISKYSDLMYSLYMSTFWTYLVNASVPYMYSFTSPYGECFTNGSLNSKYYAWRPFDGKDISTDNDDRWITSEMYYDKDVSLYIGYSFTNPISVRIVEFQESGIGSKWCLEYSDDKIVWSRTNLVIKSNTKEEKKLLYVADYGYHKHWRIIHTYSDYGYSTGDIYLLNFYGRALKVSVPAMTGDTSPYGKVICSTPYNSGYLPYYAFTDTKDFAGVLSDSVFICYCFNRPVNIKAFWAETKVRASSCVYKLQYSDNNISWYDTDGVVDDTYISSVIYLQNDYGSHVFWRLFKVKDGPNNTSGSSYTYNVQFYGLDYSEYDDVKFIYDNGIAESRIDSYTYSNKAHESRGNNSLVLSVDKGYSSSVYVYSMVDLSNYKTLRFRVRDNFRRDSYTNAVVGIYTKIPDSSSSFKASESVAYYSLTNIDNCKSPYNMGIDVSEFVGIYYVIISLYGTTSCSDTSRMELLDLWLE